MRTRVGKQKECMTKFTESQFMSILHLVRKGDLERLRGLDIEEFGRLVSALLNENIVIVFTPDPDDIPF